MENVVESDRADTRYLCEYLEHMVWNRDTQPISSSRERDRVVYAKSRLTNEMKYAIMCMVIDTVLCVSFMYLS